MIFCSTRTDFLGRQWCEYIVADTWEEASQEALLRGERLDGILIETIDATDVDEERIRDVRR